MELTIGIVSYNTRELTLRCLTAALQATDGMQRKIVLADNGSGDGTLQATASVFPNVARLFFPDNPGYGTALNRVSAAFPAPYFLAMNADVILSDDAVRRLMTYAKGHPECALVGPSLSWSDGKHQRSCKRLPTPGGLLAEIFGLDLLLPQAPWPKRPYYQDHLFTVPTEVEGLSGAAMLIRSGPFQRIGGFDSSFRLYFEETDLCLRLRGSNQRIVYVPEAKALHVHAASTRQTTHRQVTYYLSAVRYAQKHFSPRAAAAIRLGVQTSTLLRISLLPLKYPPGGRLLRAKINACRDLLKALSRGGQL